MVLEEIPELLVGCRAPTEIIYDIPSTVGSSVPIVTKVANWWRDSAVKINPAGNSKNCWQDSAVVNNLAGVNNYETCCSNTIEKNNDLAHVLLFTEDKFPE